MYHLDYPPRFDLILKERDAALWCYSCLYRKREGKSGKTACKLRGVCTNPKTVDESKTPLSDIEIEDGDDQEEDLTLDPSGKRKEMEGTPPDKSVAQKLKEDNLNDTVDVPPEESS